MPRQVRRDGNNEKKSIHMVTYIKSYKTDCDEKKVHFNSNISNHFTLIDLINNLRICFDRHDVQNIKNI